MADCCDFAQLTQVHHGPGWLKPAQGERHISAARGWTPGSEPSLDRDWPQCSDSQLRSLFQYVGEMEVRLGGRVAVEGQPCSQFLIVIGGWLRAASSRGGCQTLGAGDSWRWNAMWQRSVNDATLVAESNARTSRRGACTVPAVKARRCSARSQRARIPNHKSRRESGPIAVFTGACGHGPRFTGGGG